MYNTYSYRRRAVFVHVSFMILSTIVTENSYSYSENCAAFTYFSEKFLCTGQVRTSLCQCAFSLLQVLFYFPYTLKYYNTV
jgi:hypothetical protein